MLPTDYSLTNDTFMIYMDLALNNLQGLICRKTQPAQQPIK